MEELHVIQRPYEDWESEKTLELKKALARLDVELTGFRVERGEEELFIRVDYERTLKYTTYITYMAFSATKGENLVSFGMEQAYFRRKLPLLKTMYKAILRVIEDWARELQCAWMICTHPNKVEKPCLRGAGYRTNDGKKEEGDPHWTQLLNQEYYGKVLDEDGIAHEQYVHHLLHEAFSEFRKKHPTFEWKHYVRVIFQYQLSTIYVEGVTKEIRIEKQGENFTLSLHREKEWGKEDGGAEGETWTFTPKEEAREAQKDVILRILYALYKANRISHLFHEGPKKHFRDVFEMSGSLLESVYAAIAQVVKESEIEAVMAEIKRDNRRVYRIRRGNIFLYHVPVLDLYVAGKRHPTEQVAMASYSRKETYDQYKKWSIEEAEQELEEFLAQFTNNIEGANE